MNHETHLENPDQIIRARQSLWLYIFLSVVTFGIYHAFVYRKFLRLVRPEDQGFHYRANFVLIGTLVPYILSFFGYDNSPLYYVLLASIVLADYLLYFELGNELRDRYGFSFGSFLTIFFTLFYFQYKINHTPSAEPRPFNRPLAYILVGAIVLFTAWPSANKSLKIEEQTMAPTLIPGDRVVAQGDGYLSKQSYYSGDVVLHKDLNAKEERSIHRIWGLPGDTVEIDSDFIRIGNSFNCRITEAEEVPVGMQNYLCESRLTSFHTYRPEIDLHVAWPKETFTLGKDEYFLISDNLRNPTDGKSMLKVKRDDLIGKIPTINWSADGFNLKMDRFFKQTRKWANLPPN